MAQSIHDQPKDPRKTLTEITKKKERIDTLVDIAKQEYDHGSNYNKIIQRLELEMTISWALSPVSKREYLSTIRTTFEDTYQIRLVPEKEFNADEIDDSFIKAQSKKNFSKTEIFLNTLKLLEGEEKKPVSHNLFRNDLINTGRFTEDDAEKYIMRMRLQSAIYESKPGHYNRV